MPQSRDSGTRIGRSWQPRQRYQVQIQRPFRHSRSWIAHAVLDADTAKAHHQCGYRLLKQGYYAEALQEFRRTLEINPKRNNTYFNIGASYEYLGRFDLALKNYAQELSISPYDLDVLPRMGRVFCKTKQYRAALNCLDTALLRSQKDTTYIYRGLALEGLGSLTEAGKSFEMALMLNPNSEEAFAALARVMESEGY